MLIGKVVWDLSAAKYLYLPNDKAYGPYHTAHRYRAGK
jgi:hypothetical protein